jgi:hypothetical protein
LMRTKVPAAPTTKDFTNMFLSGTCIAGNEAKAIKIATKPFYRWDLPRK